MTYHLLQPTDDGLETVASFASFEQARMAASAEYEHTYAEMMSDTCVQIEDAQGQILYLITWSPDETERNQNGCP